MNLNGARRLYTIDEVADILAVRPATVVRWLRLGRLGGIKIPDQDGQWRIRSEDLEVVLQQGGIPL